MDLITFTPLTSSFVMQLEVHFSPNSDTVSSHLYYLDGKQVEGSDDSLVLTANCKYNLRFAEPLAWTAFTAGFYIELSVLFIKLLPWCMGE